MTIELSKEDRAQAVASIERYFRENMEEKIGNIAAGALLGFFCYMTYDLTNYATLKVWSTKVTILDIIWGTFLTGSASLAGFWVKQALLGKIA